MKFDNIVYIIEHRHAERRRQEIISRVRPTVTIDASLIGYKYLGTSLHPSDGVYLICSALANRNIDVLIMCDPPTRHHSKRAHHQRVGKKEKDKLKLMLCRLELSCAGDDAGKIQQITDDIQKLEKGECRSSLPADFVSRLQELVAKYESLGKGEITVEVAPFQADPSIADIALRGGCEAILSGDSDFAMYVGPGGADNLSDIMIRDIKINQKQSTITCCTLVTGQRAVATYINNILLNRGLTAAFPIEPKFPLFDGVTDPNMRALIALALGCDALPGGVPGVGASSLHNILSTCNNSSEAHVELATKLANQKKALVKEPKALLCLANSLVYEKTKSDVGYMHGIPTSIEKYNKAFASEHTEVVEGPPIIVCKGCDGTAHEFLEAEGVSLCMTCKASLCRFCTWDELIEGLPHTFCIECKRYSIAGNDDTTSERDMRQFLKEHAVNVPVGATYTEVLGLFRRFNDDEHAIFAEDIDSVKYPLFPTSTLNNLHESNNIIQQIKSASLRHIGVLIRSSEVEPTVVTGLVHLLASLTDIQTRQKGDSLSCTHAVSQNLIKMARNARIHSSQRLIDRSLRHATDIASPDILDGLLSLGRCRESSNDCKGDVCIIIHNKVRASMKNVEYNVKSAITHNHFLATECNCRAGCTNDASPTIAPNDVGQGRIICSHGMTLPVSLSLALYRGLAAHCLSELRLRLLHDDMEDSLSREALVLLRGDISCLMKAAGRIETALDPKRSVAQCLDMFSVGTDLPQKPPPKPNSHDLGLLREKCRYERSARKAERMVKKEDDTTTTTATTTTTTTTTTTAAGAATTTTTTTTTIIDEDATANDCIVANLSTSMEPTTDELYLNGQMALDALSIVFGRHDFESLSERIDNDNNELPIGFELQRDRSSPHVSKIEYCERNEATAVISKQWEIALLQWTTTRGRYQCKFKCTPEQPILCKKRKADSDVVNTMESKRRNHKICCVDGCDGDASELKRVPEYPEKLPKGASRMKRITYAKKFFIRKECTERLGFTRKCSFTNLRACQKHWVLVTGKSTTCKLVQANGESKDESITIPPFWAPQRIGDKSFHSPPETESKGNSTDRATFRHVMEISKDEQALANQQILEMHDAHRGEQYFGSINPRILSASGLDVHLDARDGGAMTGITTTDETSDGMNESWNTPVITLTDLVPNEVKRRTGFHDLKLMLSFAALICGGDLTILTRTSSYLTWLEEWLFYF